MTRSLHYLTAVCFILSIGTPPIAAEEYMKRGATVGDYEAALKRAMAGRRGAVPARQLMAETARVEPSPSGIPGQPKTRPMSEPVSPRAPDIDHPGDRNADVTGGVSIYFGYDSADLTRTAKADLAKLGKALAGSEFTGVSWLVEGHTDSIGTAAYNQILSEARARAARRFLVECCALDPDTLIAVGRGERQPYDRQHPEAGINRRVRLRPVDG